MTFLHAAWFYIEATAHYALIWFADTISPSTSFNALAASLLAVSIYSTLAASNFAAFLLSRWLLKQRYTINGALLTSLRLLYLRMCTLLMLIFVYAGAPWFSSDRLLWPVLTVLYAGNFITIIWDSLAIRTIALNK